MVSVGKDLLSQYIELIKQQVIFMYLNSKEAEHVQNQRHNSRELHSCAVFKNEVKESSNLRLYTWNSKAVSNMRRMGTICT